MTLWFSNWNQCLYNWISEQGWESFYLRALQPVDQPKRWTIRVMWTSYSSSPDPRGGGVSLTVHSRTKNMKKFSLSTQNEKFRASNFSSTALVSRSLGPRNVRSTTEGHGRPSLSLSLLMDTVPHTVGVTSLHCFDLDTHFVYPLSLSLSS